MKNTLTLIIFFTFLLSFKISFAQQNSGNVEEKDVNDIIGKIFGNRKKKNKDSTVEYGKVHYSFLPGVEYSVQTGLSFSVSMNTAFYTGKNAKSNLSTIHIAPAVTQMKQFFLPIQSSIWLKNNKYNLVTDWHFDRYPQKNYGLGGNTKSTDAYSIDYNYIRLYQTLYKKVSADMYLGLGYLLDYYWNVKEVDPPAGVVTDFVQYGLRKKYFSSAISLNFLIDQRRNPINPQSGYYFNFMYRPNLKVLGSNTNWHTIFSDFRAYKKIAPQSKASGVLAFWAYSTLTLSGKPPYLNLPATANDTYANAGRGYVQGRFRGKNQLYAEVEYRFQLSKNGLFGGVVFANAQSYSEITTKRFEVIAPAAGAGLRIKMNKYSKLNLALDYGFGKNGSHGFFANLGEVF